MKNPRLALAGLLLIAAGGGLFGYFYTHPEGARDPAEMLRVVGQVAGAIAGIGVALIAMSFFVRRPSRRG